MKKIIIGFCIIFVLIICVVNCWSNSSSRDEYLRFHVRANSNSSFDQYVKYEVKDKVISLIEPLICKLDSYEDAYKLLSSSSSVIEEYANFILKKHDCDYSASVQIGKEYFEEKEGNGFIMKEGVYEAMIIRLGQGNGNNWWGLVYPSLSFVPTNGTLDMDNIIYKSKIIELYRKIS